MALDASAMANSVIVAIKDQDYSVVLQKMMQAILDNVASTIEIVYTWQAEYIPPSGTAVPDPVTSFTCVVTAPTAQAHYCNTKALFYSMIDDNLRRLIITAPATFVVATPAINSAGYTEPHPDYTSNPTQYSLWLEICSRIVQALKSSYLNQAVVSGTHTTDLVYTGQTLSQSIS